MLGIALVLLFAIQGLPADKLTVDAATSRDGRNGSFQDAGRYAQLA